MNSYQHLPKSIVDESLAQPVLQGKRQLEPLLSFAKNKGIPLQIVEDHKVMDNKAEVHRTEADLWLCLEGKVQFVCGGTLNNPYIRKHADGTEDEQELRAASIHNGERITMCAGDWLWIPAGVPHQHFTEGTARLAVIKIPQKVA